MVVVINDADTVFQIINEIRNFICNGVNYELRTFWKLKISALFQFA